MKEFYHSKKQKIRGWKRHKRKIERWRATYLALDLDALRVQQCDHVKWWIHPFYALVRRNPPLWYQRQLLLAMIDVYLHWHQVMKDEEEPFYLKIWLFIPDFISSQMVVAYRENLTMYDHAFVKNEAPKLFPYHLFHPIREQLERFEWEAHLHTLSYSRNELFQDVKDGFRTQQEVDAIMSRVHAQDTWMLNGAEDIILYVFDEGDVWLGTLKD